jgi:hypothetical protein
MESVTKLSLRTHWRMPPKRFHSCRSNNDMGCLNTHSLILRQRIDVAKPKRALLLVVKN